MAVLNSARVHRLFHGFANCFHHGRRCSARSKQPGPDVKLDVVAKFLERSDIRQGSDSFAPQPAERPQLSCLNVREHHRGSGGEGVDVTPEERCERRTLPSEEHA